MVSIKEALGNEISLIGHRLNKAGQENAAITTGIPEAYLLEAVVRELTHLQFDLYVVALFERHYGHMEPFSVQEERDFFE
jgi:hypothetical protein